MSDKQSLVQEVLASYEADIVRMVDEAVADFQEALKGSYKYKRTRACCIHDFFVQKAISAWANDPNIRIIERDETARFVFADCVVMRFKKANERGLGSNIPTQTELDFIDSNAELPGLPESVKVEVVYELNFLEIKAEHVVVCARNGDDLLWSYRLENQRGTAEVTLLPLSVPTPAAAEEQPGFSIRPRVEKKDEEKKDHA